jgi:hypothetical protein
MGNYTKFSLEVTSESCHHYGGILSVYEMIPILTKLEEISGYETSFLHEDTDVKWYDSEKDMLKLSKAFPDYFFRLEGSEQVGDTYAQYFRDGTSTHKMSVKAIWG